MRFHHGTQNKMDFEMNELLVFVCGFFFFFFAFRIFEPIVYLE